MYQISVLTPDTEAVEPAWVREVPLGLRTTVVVASLEVCVNNKITLFPAVAFEVKVRVSDVPLPAFCWTREGALHAAAEQSKHKTKERISSFIFQYPVMHPRTYHFVAVEL